jgi:hypothetical protein
MTRAPATRVVSGSLRSIFQHDDGTTEDVLDTQFVTPDTHRGGRDDEHVHPVIRGRHRSITTSSCGREQQMRMLPAAGASRGWGW